MCEHVTDVLNAAIVSHKKRDATSLAIVELLQRHCDASVMSHLWITRDKAGAVAMRARYAPRDTQSRVFPSMQPSQNRSAQIKAYSQACRTFVSLHHNTLVRHVWKAFAFQKRELDGGDLQEPVQRGSKQIKHELCRMAKPCSACKKDHEWRRTPEVRAALDLFQRVEEGGLRTEYEADARFSAAAAGAAAPEGAAWNYDEPPEEEPVDSTAWSRHEEARRKARLPLPARPRRTVSVPAMPTQPRHALPLLVATAP